MKILFVNHTQQKCGVYQYGKRVFDILNKDIQHQYIYIEIDKIENFYQKIYEVKPDVIVYNWHISTMKWIDSETTNNLKNIKQLFIYHESNFPSSFSNNGFIMTDLTHDEKNKKFYLPRPIFENNNNPKKQNSIPVIGSFGFGFENKGFDKICNIVNSTFDKALIHLHITNAYFGDKDGQISNKVIENCKKMITRKNIELIITTNFMSNEDILKFLNNNTINIFLYDNMPGRGLSSTIDYAISVDTPLVVNNSNMFRHLLLEKPEISIEKNTIIDIIDMGLDSIQYFRNKWSNNNMIEDFNKILKKI